MTKWWVNRIGQLSLQCVLFLVVFSISSPGHAQGVQYSYDDLGRLIGVVDEHGNAAQYIYDASGNILSIRRYTSSQVAVLSFAPTKAQVGATVTISGANFSATPSQDSVFFNGTQASVQSASQTQIVVQVPSGATSGTISVSAPLGSATSVATFTVLTSSSGPPTIVSVSPTVTSSGATVAVTGSGYVIPSSGNSLSLNGTRLAPLNVSSPTALSFRVPSPLGSGRLSLQTSAGVANSPQDLFVAPAPYAANQVSTSQRLSSGVASTLAVPVAGNIGMFLIDGVAGQSLSTLVSNATFPYGCFGMNFTVLRPNGTPLASSSFCGQGTFFDDAVKLPLSGTYAIIVAPPSGTGTATTTAYLATDLQGTMNLNSSLAVNLPTSGQNARYTFSGQAGQWVNAWLGNSTFSGCIDMTVSILNPNGSVLKTANGCGPNDVGAPFAQLPAAGSYKVLVDPQGPSTGTGTLSLSTDVLGSLSVGGVGQFSTTVPGQNARYTFAGTAGQEVNAELTSSTFSGCLSVSLIVLNPDGSQLGSANACGSSNVDVSEMSLPSTGNYTLVVAPQNAGMGAGTVTLSTDQVNTVSVGNSAQVNIATTGQNARYTFSGTAGQQINAALTSDSFGGGACLKLLNPDGSQVPSALSCAAGNVVLSEVMLPANATYTLVVMPQGGTTGTATVTLSIDQVSTIAVGSSAQLNIQTPGQNAQYVFNGTSGQQINASLANSTFFECVKIVNPDGSQLASGCGSSSVNFSSLILPQNGTYTFVVMPQNAATGTATVNLSTNQASTPISIGSSAQVNIAIAGQNAQYTFSGTAGQQINAALTNSTFSGCFSVNLAILNPDGSQLVSGNACGSNGIDLAEVTLPTTGTYTLAVTPTNAGTGTATLTLSTDQVSTIAVGNSAQVNLQIPGQNARYTFSGAAGQQINAVLSNSTFSGCLSVNLRVLGPNGSQLASNNTCGSNSIDLAELTLPTTGTYTVVVMPQNGGAGTATVTVSTDQVSSLTIGSSAQVNMSIPGQNARYTFSGAAGQQINAVLSNSTISGCFAVGLEVLNPDGSQLSSSNTCGSSINLSSLSLSTTGNYTLVVVSQNGGTGTAMVSLSQ